METTIEQIKDGFCFFYKDFLFCKIKQGDHDARMITPAINLLDNSLTYFGILEKVTPTQLKIGVIRA